MQSERPAENKPKNHAAENPATSPQNILSPTQQATPPARQY
ncbi:MAG: hypothetical protein ACNYPH_04810 [Gammaproteobacteria bacterium WSBS_2016_MAG_OTU1]